MSNPKPVTLDDRKLVRLDPEIEKKARSYCGPPPKKYHNLTQLVGFAVLNELKNLEESK